jgi:mono/diheme cytochrome c family protein
MRASSVSTRRSSIIGGVAALVCLVGMATAAQGRAVVPGLHRWSKIDQIPRHRFVATNGVPEPYRSMRNPLPPSPATIAKGAAVYDTDCLSCHGRGGAGDGALSHDLSPSPFDIAWLAEMKISRFNGFMYWTIAEGGTPFGTSMPPYKNKLSAYDIWAVTAYVQAGLPAGSKASAGTRPVPRSSAH